jgi:hypothetical protein
MRRPLSISAALITGLLLALLAGVIAEVTLGSQGHRVQFDELPLEAQAIAKEQHPNPISPQQWKRIDEVMERHGGWPNGSDLLQVTFREAWPLFALFPAIAVLLLRWRGVALSFSKSVALVAPCALALAWAWLTQLNALLVG